ncbi:MAG: hypothetical protein ACLUFV_04795 [Acutalibacteraceae bacterium]
MTIRRRRCTFGVIVVIILLSVVLITVGITVDGTERAVGSRTVEASADAGQRRRTVRRFVAAAVRKSAGEESAVNPPEESSIPRAPPSLTVIPAMSAGTFNSVGTQYCICRPRTTILYSKNSAERAYPASVTAADGALQRIRH